jgi:Leucine-rich repeat (LRR) protein
LSEKFTTSFSQQTVLDKAMERVQSIDAFAEPLLVKALQDRFKVQLDVHKTLLQLHKPVEVKQVGVTLRTYEVVRLPLLQAALHNFEASECEPQAFLASSGFITHGATADKVESVSTSLTVPQFTELCRSLDIGAQYQRYLNEFLYAADPVAEQVLRHKFSSARKADLAATAEQALLTKDIDAADYQMIMSVVNGEIHPWMGKKQVWFRDLGLMKKRMTGCVAFVICEKYRYADELILYIPHDPHHPLKRFTWPQMETMFKQRFTARDTPDLGDGSPTQYQRFFSQFVGYADLPAYFNELNETVPAPEAIANKEPYSPLLVAVINGINPFAPFTPVLDLPPDPPPTQRPNSDPFLNAVTLTRKGHGVWAANIDLWDYLFEQHRDKLLADARSHAVPTADVDARVRSEKFSKLLNIGLLALNVVSMFVPVLGEVMMVVMAGQLLYETLEGSIEWSDGDRRAAKAHLVDIAENLALLAVMAAGGKVLSKVIAAEPEPVIEDLKQVTLDNGSQRLWRPDLVPYKAPITLPVDARPNRLGLYTHDGRTVLPLDGDPFQVRHDPIIDEYRIQHPTRPQAYAPRLQHNYEGAWQHEAESPLSWDDSTLLKRLGQPVEGVSTARLQAALESSDIDVDTLRADFLDNTSMPLVLSDTLQRFKIADEFTAFIAQMKATDPAVYAKADPVIQLELLRRKELLTDVPLRVIGPGGDQLWDFDPTSKVRRRVLQIGPGMAQGEFLQELLYTLQGQDEVLSRFPGQPSDPLPERARLLRQYLCKYAESWEGSLVEDRYRKQNLSNDPDVNRLLSRYPSLPTPMAEHLLRNFTEEQLQALRSGARLPESVSEQAQWHVQESRVSRAYEGLHVDALANADSQRLALRTLETLPGWRRGSRVELREYSATGPLRDAIGSPDATPHKTLVVMENGLFEGTPPGDIYTALWQQLSAQERQTLAAVDAAQLQMLIRRSPLPRGPMRTVLLEHPLRKPEYDPSMRLLGGALRIPRVLSRVFTPPEQRVRALFPTFGDVQVREFLSALGSNPSPELTRLEEEYSKLKKDLAAWIKEQPRSTMTLFDRQGGARKTFADAIAQSWRRETKSLKIVSGMPLNLPSLTADFPHVESLELFNTPWTTGAENFIGRFKQLKKLRITNAAMTELPTELTEMQNLAHLTLNGNRIRLTPTSVEQLGRLKKLEVLDLMGNPLHLPPDFSDMPLLKTVNLSYTGLEQWPKGLLTQANLESLILRHNALRSIPREHLYPAPEHFDEMLRINSKIDMRENAFLPETWLELDSYWQRVSQTRRQLMTLRDTNNFAIESLDTADVQTLFPEYTLGRAREYFLSLGAGAAAEITRLKAELQTLTQQLNAWAATGGVGRRTEVRAGAIQRQRYIRANEVLLDNDGSSARFTAKRRILECWRKQSRDVFAADNTPIGQELDLSDMHLQSLPALDGDFSHVGSLKLKNMQLSVSPEEFLRSFRGLRWLDMSVNQLQELPPALGEMHGLTRLYLNENQIRLTAETARLLSERTSLRALVLDDNPLGIYPDFTQMRDIRSVFMQRTGIDHWPTGLGDQPQLGQVFLGSNQLRAVPIEVVSPAAADLANSLPMRSTIDLRDNPLSPETRQSIRDYNVRTAQAGIRRTDGVGFLTGERQQIHIGAPATTVDEAFERWTRGLTQDQVAARRAQWVKLKAEPASDAFFNVFSKLEIPVRGDADLQQRVWSVIDSISEQGTESEALRTEMFSCAADGGCSDSAAMTFSDVEILKMVSQAKVSALDVTQGPSLLKLARGLFRLDEVEKIALAEIERRKAEINTHPTLSAAAKRERLARMDEVEIRLAYRYGLKGEKQLDLPGQPDKVRFTQLGDVTQQDLKTARDDVLKLNGSSAEFNALLGRKFWKDFVVTKYELQFTEMRDPYFEQIAQLEEAKDVGTLNSGDFLAQSNAVMRQVAAAEEALIERYSRTEWEAYIAAVK